MKAGTDGAIPKNIKTDVNENEETKYTQKAIIRLDLTRDRQVGRMGWERVHISIHKLFIKKENRHKDRWNEPTSLKNIKRFFIEFVFHR